MSEPESHEEKGADPQHGNIYGNYFRLIAPYAGSLIMLLIIFYLFPIRRIYQVLTFIFFVGLAAVLLITGGKLVELYFTFIYLPIYLIYVIIYLFTGRKRRLKP